MMNRPKPTQAPTSGASVSAAAAAAAASGPDKRIDDAAEQDRLDEQRHRQRDIGERQRGGEAASAASISSTRR